MRTTVAWLCLLLPGCAPSPAARPVAAIPAPSASTPATPAVPAAPTPGSISSIPTAGESPASQPVAAEPLAPPPTPILLETPYSVLGHPRLATEMLTLARDDELLQWALGGSSDPAHPANRPGYHPGTRVVIDVALLSRAPKGTTKRLLRVARSAGYWPMRSCFEAAERGVSRPERSARVRLTLGAHGKVLGARSLGGGPERDYTRCVLERVRALDFSPGAGRKLDIELSLKQWPGHAPVPPRAPQQAPGPRLAASDSAALELALPTISACYERGRARDPKLWGRLAFRVALDERGAITAADQVETRFPDAEVVECARSALLTVTLSEAASSELCLAFRLGQGAPPVPAPAPAPAPPDAPPAEVSPPPPVMPPAPPIDTHSSN